MENEKFQDLVLQQLKALTEGQGRLEARLDKLETTQEIQGRVIQSLVEGQDRLNTRFDGLETKFDGLETRFDGLETRFDGLETRFGDLETRFDRFELRMENEVIDKLRALFDDREVQNDRLDRIESKLDSLSTDVSYLVAKTATLKTLAK